MENEGNSNPLCDEPKNLDNLPGDVYRCEVHGRYVNVKKSDTTSDSFITIQEVLVNQEPTSKYIIVHNNNIHEKFLHFDWLRAVEF